MQPITQMSLWFYRTLTSEHVSKITDKLYLKSGLEVTWFSGHCCRNTQIKTSSWNDFRKSKTISDVEQNMSRIHNSVWFRVLTAWTDGWPTFAPASWKLVIRIIAYINGPTEESGLWESLKWPNEAPLCCGQHRRRDVVGSAEGLPRLKMRSSCVTWCHLRFWSSSTDGFERSKLDLLCRKSTHERFYTWYSSL